MKVIRITLMMALAAGFLTQCQEDILTDQSSDPGSLKSASKAPVGTFTVTVKNISTPYMYFEAGAIFIPEGKTDAGPAHMGESFTFSFHAGPKHKLSFATMYGWSNDGFYAPDGNGINLYSGDTPLTGDITSQIMLWDAGTEENQMPGSENMHDGTDTDDYVQLMSMVGDGYNYGTVSTNLKVMLQYNGNSMFTVTIENLGTSTTPISPVAWVVHSDPDPLFKAGEADNGYGLETLAETGNASPLATYLEMNSGYVSPVAPVLWVLHDKNDYPIFELGTPDYGIGLETLAETGNPEPLYLSLMSDGYQTGFQAIRTDGTTGPLFPGQEYEFTIESQVGQSLSIASMLGASNDEFFSTGDKGIVLSNGVARKNLTNLIELYDAGTEVNEYPGAQTQANTVENGVVRKLDDGLPWPKASQVIEVTVQKN